MYSKGPSVSCIVHIYCMSKSKCLVKDREQILHQGGIQNYVVYRGPLRNRIKLMAMFGSSVVCLACWIVLANPDGKQKWKVPHKLNNKALCYGRLEIILLW